MTQTLSDIRDAITEQFKLNDVSVVDFETRVHPDETNFVVYVPEGELLRAVQVGNDLDGLIADRGLTGFVIVRKAARAAQDVVLEPLRKGVQDSRAAELVRLITARSRVSEIQPSLSYVRDAAANISAIVAPRHHLVFGRRGAGKSALLIEAKRALESEGNLSAWINMQTLRREDTYRVFLYFADEIVSVVVGQLQSSRPTSPLTQIALELSDQIRRLLTADDVDRREVERLVPQIQKTLKRFLGLSDAALFVFIDDFYYISREAQPDLLDMLHGCVRDCNAWLKIASIRHLTRWFRPSPPVGLQTGQDADVLDLDVTLQDPGRAKHFLESVLSQYARRVGVRSLTAVFHASSLDRLVLASGAVPRDYLVLAASAIRKAQARLNSRLVGVQDVNQAAGDAAQVKIQELEDDLASNIGTAERTLSALQLLRSFCLEETGYTYYRVGFRDKEQLPRCYNVLTDLLDVRLVHLLDASVSDAHSAGERSEAFMLDLSQFSGARLKQGINVLDFNGGTLVARKTRGGAESVRRGERARDVVTILRGAPALPLERLANLT